MSQIHVNKNNEQLGPFTVDEVNGKLESGEFAPSNKGWMKGMTGWKPLSDSTFFTIGVKVADSDDGPPEISEADKLKERGKEAMGRGKEAVAGVGEGASKMVANIKSSKDVRDFLPYLKLVDVFLNIFKKMFNPKAMESWDGISRKIGFLASFLGAALIMTIAVLAFFKVEHGLKAAIEGAAILLVMGIGQYLAFRFLNANNELIEKSPSKISSKIFLKCVAVVFLMFGLYSGLNGVAQFCEFPDEDEETESDDGKKTKQRASLNQQKGEKAEEEEEAPVDPVDELILGLALLLVSSCCAGVAMNEESVNVEITEEKNTLGEEALGMLAFFPKLAVRVLPFVFCLMILQNLVLMGTKIPDILSPLEEDRDKYWNGDPEADPEKEKSKYKGKLKIAEEAIEEAEGKDAKKDRRRDLEDREDDRDTEVAAAAITHYEASKNYGWGIIDVLILPFFLYVGFLIYQLVLDLLRATLCLFKLKEE
jgi:hypothetical protein